MPEVKFAVLRAVSQELPDEVEILGQPTVERIYEDENLDTPPDVSNISLIEAIGLVAALIAILKDTYLLIEHLRARKLLSGRELKEQLSNSVSDLAEANKKFQSLSKEEKTQVLDAAVSAARSLVDEL